MALPITYNTGTSSVNANGTAVTGQGTSWLSSGVQAGDFYWAAGLHVRIASVNSNTSLTLAYPWPGAGRSADAYEVQFTPDATRALVAARQVLDALTNGNLFSVANLQTSANKLAYYTGAGTAALADFRAKGRSVVAAANLSDLLNELGPVIGGPAPVPSAAGVGLADGNYNAIRVPGAYSIAGNWTNGPRGSGSTGYNGLLVVYARQFNNGYWQILYLNDGLTYQRYTSTTDAASWPGAWEKLPSPSGANDWGASQTMDAAGGYVAWGLRRGTLTGLLEGLATGVLQLATAGSNPIAMRTNGVERTRVTESGVVLIGTDSGISPTSGANTGHHFEANGRYHRRADGYAPFIQSRLSNAGAVQEFYQGTTQVGTINVAASSTSYNTSSDYRLKENIKPLVTFSLSADQFDLLDDSLLRVMTYEPVSYDWKRTGERAHGFIAHVLQQVAPHAVSGEKDEMRDLGTITVPETSTEIEDPETGEMVPVIVAAYEIPNSYRDDTPAGATWEKTHEEPSYQGVDHSKLVADHTAAIQALTVLVLEQRDLLVAATNRIAALEGAA
jgi:hypothetical protein